MMQPLLKFLLGLMGLTLVISVHELGHLLIARLFKIEVLTFSVGIGKKILVFKGRRTEWALSLLPLGGYCRLRGEQNFIQAWEKEMDTIPYEEGSLFSAPWWQRVMVALAGPAANLVFGALILALACLIRYPVSYTEPVIIPVSHYDSSQTWPSDEGGLLPGDRIIAIDGERIDRYEQIQERVILSGNVPLDLRVEREDTRLDLTVTPRLNRETGAGYLGVYPLIEPIVMEPSEALPFLKPGDRITAVNGIGVDYTMDIYHHLQPEDAVLRSLTYLRENNPIRFVLETPVGIEELPVFLYHRSLSPSLSPLSAAVEGISQMMDIWKRTLKGMAVLFRGVKLSSALSGPLKISWMTGEMALDSFRLGFRAGFYQAVQFLALICAALAFANLLPIPVLDGGQIVLYIIDGVRSRSLTPRFIYYYQLAGTAVVLVLALFATGNDLIFFLRS